MVNNMKTIFAWLISLMLLGSGLAYAAGDYTNSAHGNSTSGVERTDYPTASEPYAKGNCAHCHEQHASVGGSEPTPTGGPDEYLLFQDYKDDSYNSFCTDKCHRAVGSWGGDDIASQYSKASTHPTTGTHTPGESIPSDFGTRHGYCIDCHNPHVAKKIDRTVGSNLVSGGPLLKVSGVSVENSTAWNNPSYTFIPAGTGIEKEYELCFKCHSSWPSPYPPTGADNAKQFNPANKSYHPVEDAMNVAGTGSAGLLFNWQVKAEWYTAAGTGKTMYCSDCHGSETSGDPVGPHGSTKGTILKGDWPINSVDSQLWDLTDIGTADFNNNCLCAKCHNFTGGNQNRYHSYSYHLSDSGNNKLAECVDCHTVSVHGYNTHQRFIADSADGDTDYNYLGTTAKVTAFTKRVDGNYQESNCDTVAACQVAFVHRP